MSGASDNVNELAHDFASVTSFAPPTPVCSPLGVEASDTKDNMETVNVDKEERGERFAQVVRPVLLLIHCRYALLLPQRSMFAWAVAAALLRYRCPCDVGSRAERLFERLQAERER